MDFNRVYTTQAALVTQQDQQTEAQASIALNLIAVYRALGGGWRVRCGDTFTPPATEVVPSEPAADSPTKQALPNPVDAKP